MSPWAPLKWTGNFTFAFLVIGSGPISGNQLEKKKKNGLSGFCKMVEQMGQMVGKAQEFWIPFPCPDC